MERRVVHAWRRTAGSTSAGDAFAASSACGCSTTRPTVLAGRCGECGTLAGSRKISPWRMGMSRGLPSSMTLQDDVALDLVEQLLAGVDVVVAARLGPPTTMTRKSLFQIMALPTGGRSRWRWSSIQAWRLNGAAAVMAFLSTQYA